MTRGILLFAYNNEAVDYGTMAMCASVLAKANMGGIATALVTDEPTMASIRAQHSTRLIDATFDEIIITEVVDGVKNFRRYSATNGEVVRAQYKNINRLTAYDLTPFDETLIIDSDYLMLDGSLNTVWDQSHDLLINRSAHTVETFKEMRNFRYIDVIGIRMFWATVVFFRRTPETKLFFDLVAHVKEHYRYYSLLYRYDTARYRNDFTFTVAAHLMNGDLDSREFVGDLPTPHILTAFEPNGLAKIIGPSAAVFHAKGKDGAQVPVRIETNVHCMNKQSILENSAAILGFANA